MFDEALLERLDASEEVRREGRSAVLRRATADFLLTAIHTRMLFPDTSAIIYPDPPLSTRELMLMDDFGLEFQTLRQWTLEVRR